ncbi:hypothetical protein BDEG_26320 [Batrachochytrium dendrobatidis JEL423]|uniref:Uncharacterized protein n=1 Tax=Batrachochytrium dendrobatidis (strain JEL423) TaxID=403673 RepID=A0A177WS44_BATDL|nr:hypothetical protein BDEG_26320 [Batrachochytrium dendrobatidis JEL423]
MKYISVSILAAVILTSNVCAILPEQHSNPVPGTSSDQNPVPGTSSDQNPQHTPQAMSNEFSRYYKSRESKFDSISKRVAEILDYFFLTGKLVIDDKDYAFDNPEVTRVGKGKKVRQLNFYWSRYQFTGVLLGITSNPPKSPNPNGRYDEPIVPIKTRMQKVQTWLGKDPKNQLDGSDLALVNARATSSVYADEFGVILSLLWSISNEYYTWAQNSLKLLDSIQFQTTHAFTLAVFENFKNYFKHISTFSKQARQDIYRTITDLTHASFDLKTTLMIIQSVIFKTQTNFDITFKWSFGALFNIYLDSELYDADHFKKTFQDWIKLHEEMNEKVVDLLAKVSADSSSK